MRRIIKNTPLITLITKIRVFIKKKLRLKEKE